VIGEQLRAPAEKLAQRLGPLVGAEAVFLLDRYPGQLAPLGRELVAVAGQLLFPGQQFAAGNGSDRLADRKGI
jgi:hypothetical protein